MLAPIGSIESFTPGGAAAAKAAARFGVPQMLSSACNPGLEETAAAADTLRIFQLYVRGDDAVVDNWVRRARDHGYRGFCLTVDSAYYSRRERDLARRFVKPWRASATGLEYQRGLVMGPGEALQGRAPERPARSQGHRHRGGRGRRLPARGRGRVRLEPRRPSARPRPRQPRGAARGRPGRWRAGARLDRRRLRPRHGHRQGDRARGGGDRTGADRLHTCRPPATPGSSGCWSCSRKRYGSASGSWASRAWASSTRATSAQRRRSRRRRS